MGNNICTTNSHAREHTNRRTMSAIRNFEPQTTIIIGQGIPNVSSQVPKNPQQNRFEFNDTYFDSKFESGNLAQVERIGPDAFNLWIAPDCYKTDYQVQSQSWFYFKVGIKPFHDTSNIHSRTIRLTIKNLSLSEINNFSEGMTPVYRTKSTYDKWEYLPSGVEKVKKDDYFLTITLQYRFTNMDSSVYFAYSFPYTYSELNEFLGKMEKQSVMNKKILFQRDKIGNSIEGRPIELITITARESSNEERPSRTFVPSSTSVFTSGESQDLQSPIHVRFYQNRKYVLITCRSQASDTSSSHVLEGFIRSLLSHESLESRNACENFVFLVVPMMNPDGVIRGHTLTDTRGKKISTSYRKNASKEHYPAQYAIRKLVADLKFELHMYWDLESSIAQGGATLEAYMSGNQTYDAEAVAIARLFEIHNKHFSLPECRFVHSDGILKSLPLISESQLFQKHDKIPLLKFESELSLKQSSCNNQIIPQNLGKDFKATQKSHRRLARNFVASMGRTHLSFSLRTNLFKGKKHQQGESCNLDSLLDIEESKQESRVSYLMTQDYMKGIGTSLMDVILEFNSCHPKSLLPSSQYVSLDKLKYYSQILLRSNNQRDLRNTIA